MYKVDRLPPKAMQVNESVTNFILATVPARWLACGLPVQQHFFALKLGLSAFASLLRRSGYEGHEAMADKIGFVLTEAEGGFILIILC